MTFDKIYSLTKLIDQPQETVWWRCL